MSLILEKEIVGGGKYGLWRVEEDEDFFASNLHLFDSELEELSKLSSRKRIEWLASRYLLHDMLGENDRIPCLKDQYGKPHLKGSGYEMSLSHSRDFVAVSIHPRACGIDIQYPVMKISRIAKKYINQYEESYLNTVIDVNQLHIIWGAKESIYKAYGRKGVDFKNEIKIDPFVMTGSSIHFSGFLQRETITKEYQCFACLVEDYFLVLAIES